MLTIMFIIGIIYVFGKLFFIGMHAAWGISKLLLLVLFWPVILVGMFVAGLLYVAIPILFIMWIISLFAKKRYY